MLMLNLRLSFTVTLCLCSSMGSFPQNAVLPELILHGLGKLFKNSSNTGLYHGVHPSGVKCSIMGPPREAAPAKPPALLWALLHGPQPLSGQIHLLHHGLLHWLQCGDLLCCSTPWAAEEQPAPPLHRLQGNFCSGLLLWSTTCSPSLTLVSSGLRLSTFSHSSLQLLLCSCFIPFLNYVLTEAQPTLLIGSDVLYSPAGSHFWLLPYCLSLFRLSIKV